MLTMALCSQSGVVTARGMHPSADYPQTASLPVIRLHSVKPQELEHVSLPEHVCIIHALTHTSHTRHTCHTHMLTHTHHTHHTSHTHTHNTCHTCTYTHMYTHAHKHHTHDTCHTRTLHTSHTTQVTHTHDTCHTRTLHTHHTHLQSEVLFLILRSHKQGQRISLEAGPMGRHGAPQMESILHRPLFTHSPKIT